MRLNKKPPHPADLCQNSLKCELAHRKLDIFGVVVRKISSQISIAYTILNLIMGLNSAEKARIMTDTEERAKTAVIELQKLLRDSYSAAQQLKRDIPSEHFPTAYELSSKIRELRKTVEYLRAELNNETMEFELDMSLFTPERLDSSESSASIC